MQIRQLIDWLESFAPLSLAENWDNVGLLLGSREHEVDRVMTCLTLTQDVAHEAVQNRCGMIITHHPLMFRAIQRLTDDSIEGKIILALLAAGIAVYSPHTAFDSAELGINHGLAARLGLHDLQPLRPVASPEPTQVLQGAGRWGRLPQPLALNEFLQHVQTCLAVERLAFVGEPQHRVQTVGVACGSAGEFLNEALQVGCDAFLTGETRFHTALEARASGIALILAGHYATERPGVEELARCLARQFPRLTVWASRSERDPLQWT